ncbi:MAG: 5-nucleotidase [Solirubrobacteraceae bacterium]|nr:5-nucleotidase [Solirubrobacteraceae bacterium]
MSSLRLLGAAGALLLVLASPAAAHQRDHHPHHQPKDVKVQLLSINDFHGNLQSTTTGGIRPPTPAGQAPPPAIPAGGAAFLGSYVRELERTNRNSMLVSAGDLIGASPLLSALYHDEPTIEAMNLLGLDLNAVGNHEFDEGAAELRRMQQGGCHPTEGCKDGDGFKGADFKFLAANVISRDNGKPFFRPYVIRRFEGKKIGFIGMTLKGTPSIVSPAGIQSLEFLDEAATANRYARELKRRHGVKAIVVLLHEGGFQSVPFNTETINTCTGISGPVVDIVKHTTKAVDLFITGHTHQAYNCLIDGRPVTSASSFGRLLTDLDLTLGRNGDVKSVSRNNIPIYTAGRTPVADVQALVDRYDKLSAPLRQTPVGRISSSITRDPDPDGSRENAAGNLIADAQLADTDDAGRGNAVGALMNPGGVRADFEAPNGGPETITYEEAFTVQPFNNIVATQTFTGAQLLDVFKDQWCGTNSAPTVLLPSSTIHYTTDLSIAAGILGKPCAGAANPVSGVTIGGAPLDPAATYRITTNNFLADGGDDFPSLKQGTGRTTLSDFDIDSLVRYLQPSLQGTPIGPPALDRIGTTP